MITCPGLNINDTFHALCTASSDWPVENRRGGVVRDSPYPVGVTIYNPRQNVLNVPRRNNNIAAACAETLWVLAGRNDIEWLSEYLPRAKDFSDDGKAWRAGYGPRLRNYPGGNLILAVKNRISADETVEQFYTYPAVDQLEFVVDELRSDPNSRRAVITILDPPKDSHHPIITKDFPCTQSLSFMVRNGKLDLTVFIRSNDLIWGMSGVNIFEFTIMQQLVAQMLGIEVGKYFHISNNLHVYEKHFKIADSVAAVDVEDVRAAYAHWKAPKYTPLRIIEDMDENLKQIFDREHILRDQNSTIRDVLDGYCEGEKINNTLLDDMALTMMAYYAAKHDKQIIYKELSKPILDNALRDSLDRFVAWSARSIPRQVDSSE